MSKTRPSDVTFDKYQKAYYREKTFDVDVSDGQLNLEFQGENWACCVSAVVIFPVEQAAKGEAFLKTRGSRRRFYFDNYFKRVLPAPTGDPLRPTEDDGAGASWFFSGTRCRTCPTTTHRRGGKWSIGSAGEAFAGEYEPMTVALVPLDDLGRVDVSVSDLVGPAGTIPATAIDVGHVSYRISRVTAEGTVYTITPRLIMPGGTVDMPQGVIEAVLDDGPDTRGCQARCLQGDDDDPSRDGRNRRDIPIEFRVRSGTLDPVDIPAGPFGYTIGIPWYGDDPRPHDFNQQMVQKSLQKMRDYGFTACSGLPSIAYQGLAGASRSWISLQPMRT